MKLSKVALYVFLSLFTCLVFAQEEGDDLPETTPLRPPTAASPAEQHEDREQYNREIEDAAKVIDGEKGGGKQKQAKTSAAASAEEPTQAPPPTPKANKVAKPAKVKANKVAKKSSNKTKAGTKATGKKKRSRIEDAE